MLRKSTILAASLVCLLAGVTQVSSAVADTPPAEPVSSRPKVVVLVSVTAPGGVASSFGTEGTDEIAVRTLVARAISERGFDVVSAAGEQVTRVAVGEEASAALLADASAADLARKLGAGIAIIVGLEGTGDGKIRGTRMAGAIAAGSARLLDVSTSRVLADESIKGAGFGNDVNAAVERAFRDAARAFGAAFAAKAAKAWPADVPSSGDRTHVVIRGARTWGSVSAIIRRLATTRGVAAVHPESISGDEVRLAIETTLSSGALVSAIRDARLLNGSLSAKASGGGISVSVRGE